MAIILDITSHYMYYHRFVRYGTDFPGGPVAKILHSQFWGSELDPWSRN